MTVAVERLREAGFEPPDNVCATCKHPGGEHDFGNWCLTCPRPEPHNTGKPFGDRIDAGWDYFSSMTDDEKWAYGIALLEGSTA